MVTNNDLLAELIKFENRIYNIEKENNQIKSQLLEMKEENKKLNQLFSIQKE